MKQRDQSKHNSLRVVYFGSRAMFRGILQELSHSQTYMTNISWLVMEHPEDRTPPLDVASDNLPVGTLVVSQSQIIVSEAEQFVNSKWEKVCFHQNL